MFTYKINYSCGHECEIGSSYPLNARKLERESKGICDKCANGGMETVDAASLAHKERVNDE
jgi:hypothetical protein